MPILLTGLFATWLVAPGVLDDRDPVHPVWIMLAEDGRREELNPFEAAMAHGVEVRRTEGGEAREIAVRAMPDLPIRIGLVDGCPTARTRIGGREATLRLVLVTATSGLIPEVVQVELVGVEGTNGIEVRERTCPVDGPDGIPAPGA